MPPPETRYTERLADWTMRAEMLQSFDLEERHNLLREMRRQLEDFLREELKMAGGRGLIYRGLRELPGAFPAVSRHQLEALHDLRLRANDSLHKQTYALSPETLGHCLINLCKLYAAADGQLLPKSLQALEKTLPPIVFCRPAEGSFTSASGADMRARVVRVNARDSVLVVHAENDPELQAYEIHYGRPAWKAYAQSIQRLMPGMLINLVNATINDESGMIEAYSLIVEPDYLVDVTAIAECVKDEARLFQLYGVKRYFPDDLTRPLVVGNIANMILDMCVHATDPDRVTEQDVMRQAFAMNTLELSYLLEKATEGEKQLLRQEIAVHLQNIKKCLREEFTREKIERSKCVLEPGFLSTRYGLNGRLDLLYARDKLISIVELKSGRNPQSILYPTWSNHKAQALLYKLLLQGQENARAGHSRQYILYSKDSTRALRDVAYDDDSLHELVATRNRMVLMDAYMAQADVSKIYDLLLASVTQLLREKLPSYEEQKLSVWAGMLKNAAEPLKAYTAAWCRFIHNEAWLNKLGDDYTNSSAQSQAWLMSGSATAEGLPGHVDGITIAENACTEDPPTLLLRRPRKEGPPEYRKGDIAMLMPQDATADITCRQVHKGTIIEVGPDTLRLQLRHRQGCPDEFEGTEVWQLRPDYMDKSLRAMYLSLFEMLRLHTIKDPRGDRLLGIAPPRMEAERWPAAPDDPHWAQMDNYMADCVQRALSAPDYFLLCGPPGTGKTSRALKNIARQLYFHTEERILFLAYTNRAVDEICHALRQAEVDFLRVGHRYSTDPALQAYLLDTHTKKLNRLDDCLSLLKGKRIMVATLASITGRPFLMKMFGGFDRIIVDEASQILEPAILPVLARVPRFVLIGDEKQLPAITLQSPEDTAVKNPALAAIALTDLRDSYFERMLRLGRERGWDYCMGTLRRQGRMHPEIMRFPNERFYENLLQSAQAPHQTAPAGGGRLRFINSGGAAAHSDIKCHPREAEIVTQMALEILDDTLRRGEVWNPGASLGIITPYRHQSALIRQMLQQTGREELESVTVDTVERYQGAERDVIIISMCLNNALQLRHLVNRMRTPGLEHIDRKMNVMITRARHRLIITGNEDLLRQDDNYCALLDMIAEYEKREAVKPAKRPKTPKPAPAL